MDVKESPGRHVRFAARFAHLSAFSLPKISVSRNPLDVDFDARGGVQDILEVPQT